MRSAPSTGCQGVPSGGPSAAALPTPCPWGRDQQQDHAVLRQTKGAAHPPEKSPAQRRNDPPPYGYDERCGQGQALRPRAWRFVPAARLRRARGFEPFQRTDAPASDRWSAIDQAGRNRLGDAGPLLGEAFYPTPVHEADHRPGEPQLKAAGSGQLTLHEHSKQSDPVLRGAFPNMRGPRSESVEEGQTAQQGSFLEFRANHAGERTDQSKSLR